MFLPKVMMTTICTDKDISHSKKEKDKFFFFASSKLRVSFKNYLSLFSPSKKITSDGITLLNNFEG